MFTNYSVFTFYGLDEITRDIIHYCVNNPRGLDFGERLHITYRKLEFGTSCVIVLINYNDYETLKEFALVARLIREARNG